MKPTITDIEEILSLSSLSKLPSINISILRNIILEPIQPYLRYYAYQSGLNAQVKFGEYDNIFQEAVGGNRDLLNADTDCVLLFMFLESVSCDIARNFVGLKQKVIADEVNRIKQNIIDILSGIRRQTDAMILWHSFEYPANPSLGIYDAQIENGQVGVVIELNRALKDCILEFHNAYLVDLNLCLLRIGAKCFYDLRYWHIGRAPYSREALQEIAFENLKFIRPLKGKNKKCLALDCDNTLWGGIIGEDGLSGIKLGKTHPGSSYFEFQQEVINLYNRGIIIALCSKNNEEDVWEVFKKHPDMVLKEEYIAASQINWKDKAQNLRQISLDLNIGLDSIVFIDDSDFEINLIRELLPEVETIQLPPGRAFEYRDMLSKCGLFDTLTISDEDKKRGEMYRAETGRKKLMAQITDMVSYYKSLEMIVEINFANDFSFPRIAQQTQKTNQFNLTTRRYNEADIESFSKSVNSDVTTLRLKDKFGDSGIVGTCILIYENNMAIFDTFLLSCRVLGRGVEDAFIVQALKLAQKRSCIKAIGEYYRTSKNRQVENFYEKQGFKELKTSLRAGDRVFEYDLITDLKAEPYFFKEIISEIDNI